MRASWPLTLLLVVITWAVTDDLAWREIRQGIAEVEEHLQELERMQCVELQRLADRVHPSDWWRLQQ